MGAGYSSSICSCPFGDCLLFRQLTRGKGKQKFSASSSFLHFTLDEIQNCDI